MSSPNLTKWVETQKSKEKRAQFIETGLLGNSLIGYYTYRLKFFLVRTIVAALIFAIEVKILIAGLGEEIFTYAIGPRILVGLLSAYWWACLESMRSEIRTMKREDKAFLIPRIIQSWRQRARRLSEYSAVIGLLLIIIAITTLPQIASGPLILYWVSLVVRTCVEIPLRTFHSSVYATRRIYRPLMAILGTELFGLAMFLTLKPTLGAWSVGISTLIGMLLSTLITYYYTKKTFKHLGYQQALINLKEKPKPMFPIPPLRKVFKEGLPLSLFRFDSVIALLLVATYTTTANGTGTATANAPAFSLLALAVCIPILQASQEWSQLLYFDYKRLELISHKWLKKRFEGGLKFVAVSVSLCLWGLSAILTRAVSDSWQWPPWQLLALLISSSLCGQQAIRIFSMGSQRELTLWGLSILFSMLTLVMLGKNTLSALDMFAAISVILIIHTWAMRLLSKDYPKSANGYILPPTLWVKKLSEQKYVWGGWIKLKPTQTQPKTKSNHPQLFESNEYIKNQIAKELIQSSKRDTSPLKIASLSKNLIVFYQEVAPIEIENNTKAFVGSNPTPPANPISKTTDKVRIKILTQMTHLVEDFGLITDPTSSTTFLKEIAGKEPKLENCFKMSKAEPHNSKDLESIRNDLEKVFKNIIVIDLKNPQKQPSLKGEDCRNILSAALRYHKSLGQKSDPFCRDYDVTCKDENGAIREIFAIPKFSNKNTSLLIKWRELISAENLYNAWNNHTSHK
jgi:hypothetical protein